MGAFPPTMFPTFRDVYLTSEPEASALNIVQGMLKEDRHPLIRVRLSTTIIRCDPELTVTGGMLCALRCWRRHSSEFTKSKETPTITCLCMSILEDLVSYRTDSIEPLRLTRVGGISGKVTQ